MEFKDDGIANTLTQEQLGQMTDEQIEEMATAYSEGNSGLKELLKYCAKNQIPTFASCGGHPDDPKNDAPYIGFILDDSTIEIFSKISPQILKSSRIIAIDKYDTLSRLIIYVKKEKSEIEFKNLKKNLEDSKQFPKNASFNKLAYIIQHTQSGTEIKLKGNSNGEISNIEFSNLSEQLKEGKIFEKTKSSDEGNIFRISQNIDTALDTIIEDIKKSENKEDIISENKSLKHLLEYCSAHEISVFNSRGVTINNKADANFIAFNLNDKNKGVLSKLFLEQLNKNSEIGLWKYDDDIRLGIYCRDSNSDSEFAQIQGCFEEYEKNPAISDDVDLLEKMSSFLQKDSHDFSFSLYGLEYAKKRNLPLFTYWGYDGVNEPLPEPLPINEYTSDTNINPCKIIDTQFENLVQSLENPKQEHIKNQNDPNSKSLTANIKNFCKKVSYKQLGMNVLNFFISKVKKLGKTKDNERSESWTK